MKTIGVLFADGFEEMEAITIADVLRRAELDVVLIGIGGLCISGAHAISVNMDNQIDDILPGSLDAVVLPGGMPGAENLANDDKVKSLLQEMNDEGKYIGAICAAPMALNAAGLITDKTVTCYPSFESTLGDAVYTGDAVTVDGNIVTGKGPGAAFDFTLKLVALLTSPDKANELATALLVD